MRAMLNVDELLLALACEFTGETEKAVLVRMGLEALVEREAFRRLALLGARMPSLEIPERTRVEMPNEA